MKNSEWEILTVALDSLRIAVATGHPEKAKVEIAYLQNKLNEIFLELQENERCRSDTST
jgi:hypothetical protein